MAVKSKLKTKTKQKSRKSKLKAKAKPKSTRKVGAKRVNKAKKVLRRVRTARKPVASVRNSIKSRKRVAAPVKNVVRSFIKRSVGGIPERYSPSPARYSASASPIINRVPDHSGARRPVPTRTPRIHQFSYMKAPGIEHAFDVGDSVEVFCDHEKNHERIRGWVNGIVVQVDNKMVAVQFRSNVYLTDGWMVPDRILWYPVNSEHIRPLPGRKPMKKDLIPEY